MTRPIHWRGGIYTPNQLHSTARRFDRRVNSINAALAAMRRGESLHLQYAAGRQLWSLSGGRCVSAEVANLLISNASIVPVGDTLFDGMPGQT
jgi:hypothetical protein